MLDFDLTEFLMPLAPTVILMAACIGCGLGVARAASSPVDGGNHLFWMLAGGFIFFIPLSIVRGLQGSTTWERFAATIVLWATFAVGAYLGEQAYRRIHRRK